MPSRRVLASLVAVAMLLAGCHTPPGDAENGLVLQGDETPTATPTATSGIDPRPAASSSPRPGSTATYSHTPRPFASPTPDGENGFWLRILGTCGEARFEPPEFMIDAGQYVAWANHDEECAHTATGDNDTFDTGRIGPGDASGESIFFEEAGTYRYSCAYHANMTAVVHVAA